MLGAVAPVVTLRGVSNAVKSALFPVLWLLSSLALLTPRTVAQAYTFAPLTVGAVGSPVTVTLTVTHAGVLGQARVVGQGNTGVDFLANGAGSCTNGASYAAGQTCTVAVSFAPAYPGSRGGAIVLAAAGGAVLATRFLAGIGLGGIGTFVPGMILPVAGAGSWLYAGDAVPATAAPIYLPFGVAVDSAGNVFIADYGNNRIRKVTASTGVISTVAGDGILGVTGDRGPAIQASLSGPDSVALDGAGNIFFCDSGNNAVRRIDASTGIVDTVAGTIGTIGYTGDGGPATSATLSGPNGIAVDLSGNLYIADSTNNVIRRVDAVTGTIATVAGKGVSGFSGDGGPAVAAKLNSPWSVTTIPTGGFYIADQGNNRIRRVDAAGTIATFAGTGVADAAGDGGLASAADLNAPANVVADAAGNLYISDSGNNLIRKVNAGSSMVSTIAGPGNNTLGFGGAATAASFSGPYSLAMDGTGNLYFGDVFQNRVLVIQADFGSLVFANMRIGRVSPPQQINYENDGNASFDLSAVLAASQSVLEPATTCAGGLILNPLDVCSITAAFAPTSLGANVGGYVNVISNAANTPGHLALEGAVLSQDPSSISLAASTNLASAGTSIFFTVTVASQGVVPTGLITLLDGGNAIATASLGQGGVVTFTVSTLAGGQHIMTASYPGDSNNTAAESAPVAVVIQYVTAPTATTLAGSPNPALAGSPITLTATVALVSAGTGVGTISGPVIFTEGTTILGAAAVSNGPASLKLPTLSAGMHSIVASYGGTTSFGPSASAPLFVTVQPGTSKTLLSSASNPSAGGAPLLLTATVTSNGPKPTGTVTFVDGNATLGTASIGAAGIATLTVAALAVGSHSLGAIYAGDMMNDGGASPALLQTVVLATTATALKSSANPSPQGGAIVFTTVVTGNGGIPGGPVQFIDGTVNLGIAPLDGTGTATFSTATLGLGTHTITASYGGDPLDGPSVSTAIVETIQSATTTMALSSSLNPSGFAANVTCSVQVQGTGAQPAGAVTLLDGMNVLGVQTLNAGGVATFQIATLTPGAHNLVALYGGDTYHSANSAKLTQTVLQVTTAVLAGSAGGSIAGTPLTFTAVVAGLNGQPVTGSLQFKDGQTALATMPLGAGGAASLSTSALGVGAHSVSALYSGDSANEPATSNSVVETVQIATTSISLASSANPAFSAVNLTLTASVAGNGAVPGGLVTFHDGATVVGIAAVSANGVATLSTNALPPGLHSLTALYNGDPNDSPATSAMLPQEIIQQTTLTISSSADPAFTQNAVTISVTVGGGAAANPATGGIALTDNGTALGTAALNSSGVASFALAAPALGSHTLAASYAGDSRYTSASSSAFAQTVILRPTATDLKTSATQISAGQPITFFAAVQGAGPSMPTGTVHFVNGAAVLGSATLDAAGVAALTVDPAQGSDQVVAQYQGDALFAVSNSLPGAVLVGPPIAFNIAVAPAAVSMKSGAHATLQVAIGVAAGFADTLEMGCAGLPASATCTFSQDQLKVAGAVGQTISMVVDTGNPLGAGASASLSPERSGTVLACLLPGCTLLGMLWRGRRRFAGLAMPLLLSMVAATLSGCGNSLSVNDTSAGSYTFQIVGTGAASGVTQSATVALTVTP